MRRKRQGLFADSILCCLLFICFAATEQFIVHAYLHAVHAPNFFIVRDYMGLLQHNMETIVKCKLFILDLNVITISDFYQAQGAEPPLLKLLLILDWLSSSKRSCSAFAFIVY